MEKLLILTLLALTADCNVIPSLGQPPVLSPAETALLDAYGNFTTGIAKALVDNDVAMQSGPHSTANDACPLPDQGIQATSGFGLGHLLAIINENVWIVGVPVFQDLLTATPNTLPDSFEYIFKKLLPTSDITFSSAIFTADTLSMTPGLMKLNVQVVNTDLTQKTSTDAINAYLNKFIGKPLDQNYIPKEATISPAAKAVLVDTVHVSETWDATVSKVQTPPKFNGVDTVDMIEVVGAFQVLENDNAIEVILPFKNTRRSLSLVLSKETAAALNGNLGEPKHMNFSSVRVQIPTFKTTLRNYESNLTNQCGFKQEQNFFQLLDHVIQISLDQNSFETLSITGAQINDVQKFKSASSNSDKAAIPCTKVPQGPAVVPQTAAAGDSSTAEKIIILNRSFTWTLLDQDLGPIMAGSVDSPIAPQLTTSPSAPFVFGLENPLGYAKCL